jgi:glycosyltransferase involved in cell wall biosynthesis
VRRLVGSVSKPVCRDRNHAPGRAGFQRALAEFAASVVGPLSLAVLGGGWRSLLPAQNNHERVLEHAEAAQNILLDVSLSLAIGWRTPVGMSRVEGEVADRLCRDPAFDVQLICKSEENGGFRHLSPFELEFLAHRSDALGQRAAAALAVFPPPERPPALERTRHRARAALRLFGGSRVTRSRLLRPWLQRWIERAANRSIAIHGAPVEAEPGDVLVCTSNPWDYVAPESFRQLRARAARFILVVHDLMVWETPHLTAGRDPRAYSNDMCAVIAEADGIVAVSKSTAKSVAVALASLERPTPPMVVAHPTIGFAVAPAVDCPAKEIDASRPFVLFCSTIEIRKNHILLLHLWERLRTTLPPERLPQLVFVGRWGWGVDAVRLSVERNWRLASHLRVLEDVRDDVLLWLYRNARFTLFPSFTEGFGLPVAESLSVGTPVLISDLPALREASEDTMPALDPFDLPAWQREVAALCVDDARLEALREKARAYCGPRPGELADAVVAMVRTNAAASPSMQE